jgi:carbohydrate-selective porin OprB
LPNDATGVQTDQVLIELSYDIHLVEGADLMPDFQYMIRPDAQKISRTPPCWGSNHISRFNPAVVSGVTRCNQGHPQTETHPQ